jgi:hypothetical protein
MGQLLELYFTHQNIYLPLLHRPTFERGVLEGLHLRFVVIFISKKVSYAREFLIGVDGVRAGLSHNICLCRDDGFAATVLVVCAIGSRWSMDPRMTGAGLSCGWEWFNQVGRTCLLV